MGKQFLQRQTDVAVGLVDGADGAGLVERAVDKLHHAAWLAHKERVGLYAALV